MKKTLKQTPLMDWIKTIHVDFYLGFHKFLADNFNFWGVKQENGEYIWFCVMNESCQSGMLLQYIATIDETDSTKEIKDKCFEILLIKPKIDKFLRNYYNNVSPEKRIELINSEM